MSTMTNPFPENTDRYQLWNMLVNRDIKAFINQDWQMVASDFLEDEFYGTHAWNRTNPDSWKLTFPTLASYKNEWLRQASDFNQTNWSEDPEKALFAATNLRDIEIKEDKALLHKKFDGTIEKIEGSPARLNWQTLYRCRKVNGTWKISGFTGYLPHPMGSADQQYSEKSQTRAIRKPSGTKQHETAGPYSPVLKVRGDQMIVISGQAAINQLGEVVGVSIEDQARLTLENCRQQLVSAGSSMSDVFKVTVYLTDLGNWPRFNEVYKEFFDEPRPVRTAIQTGLLDGLMVEVELWAAK